VDEVAANSFSTSTQVFPVPRRNKSHAWHNELPSVAFWRYTALAARVSMEIRIASKMKRLCRRIADGCWISVGLLRSH